MPVGGQTGVALALTKASVSPNFPAITYAMALAAIAGINAFQSWKVSPYACRALVALRAVVTVRAIMGHRPATI